MPSTASVKSKARYLGQAVSAEVAPYKLGASGLMHIIQMEMWEPTTNLVRTTSGSIAGIYSHSEMNVVLLEFANILDSTSPM